MDFPDLAESALSAGSGKQHRSRSPWVGSIDQRHELTSIRYKIAQPFALEAASLQWPFTALLKSQMIDLATYFHPSPSFLKGIRIICSLEIISSSILSFVWLVILQY